VLNLLPAKTVLLCKCCVKFTQLGFSELSIVDKTTTVLLWDCQSLHPKVVNYTCKNMYMCKIHWQELMVFAP